MIAAATTVVRVARRPTAPLRQQAYAAFIRACHRRVAATRRGHKIKAGERMAEAIQETRAMGERDVQQGNTYIEDHRQLLINGKADAESVRMVYGWFGNVMTAMGQRYRRGNRSMKLGLYAMWLGRCALRGVYARYMRLGRVGFSGIERVDFDNAVNLGQQFMPSISRMELREAFRLSDARHKNKTKPT